MKRTPSLTIFCRGDDRLVRLTVKETFLTKSRRVRERGRTYAEVIADQLIAKAVAGDVSAAKEVCDRTEGKPRQAVALTHDNRAPLEIAVRNIMDKTGCTKEEAIRGLGAYRPEALALLDTN